MATSTAVRQTKEARALAHKLFSQCRDSPGPYRSISSDVRKLRNVLEELEEALAEDTFDDNQRSKALPVVANGRSILSKLDLAVQSFRCAKDQQIDEHEVASFKRSLESATDELTSAYDILTGSAEIAVKLVGRMSYDSFAAPPSITSAKNAHRQSEDSSACSAVTAQDGKSQSSQTDLSIASTIPKGQDRRPNPSDEKELYIAELTSKLARPSPTKRSPSSFSSPFASPDPMSMDFERASSLIMAVEGHATSASTSDAEAQETGPFAGDASTPAVRSDTDPAGTSPVHSKDSQSGDAVAQPKDKTAVEGSHQLPNNPIEQNERTSDTLLNSTEVREDSFKQNDGIQVAKNSECRTTPPMPIENLKAMDLSHRESNIPSTTEVVQAESKLEHITTSEEAMDFPVVSRMTAKSDTATSTRNQVSTSGDSVNNKHEDDDDVPLARLMSKRKRQKSEVDRDQSKDSQPARTAPKTPPPRRSRQASASRIVREDSCLPPPPYNSLKPNGWQSHDFSKGKLAKQRSLSASNIYDCKGDSKAARELSRVRSEDYPADTVRILDLAMRPVRAVSETFGEPVFTFPPSPDSKARTSEPRSPPLPRRPPPPLPSTSAPTPEVLERPSRYRITNPTLPEATSITKKVKEEDTDDDLYTSSRRASPIIASKVPHIRVSIDEAPLELNELRKDNTITVESVARGVHRNSTSMEPASPPMVPPRPARSPASSPNIPSQTLLTTSNPSKLSEGTSQQNRARSTSFEHDRSPSLKDCAKEVKAPTIRRASAAPVLPRGHSITAPQVNRAGSNHAPERSNSKTAPEISSTRQQAAPGGVREFYNPDRLHGSFGGGGVLDEERASAICVAWHYRDWDLVASYLQEQLVSMIEQDCVDGMRRVRHLLGVAASYDGKWNTAIKHFLSVISKRITDISDIDEGSAAAAYWLGDVYALHNRRDEAMVAYSIASYNPVFTGRERENYRECLMFEQEALLLNPPTRSFLWLQVDSGDNEYSILHPSIITKEAANKCLQCQPWSTPDNRHHRLQAGNQDSRFRNMFIMPRCYNKVKLSRQELMVGGSWPFPYDPLFATGSVHEGRLFAHECDMLQVFETNPDAKVTRSGPLGFSRRECFTHNDLFWLVKATRSCLEACGLEWSEILNVSGAWFCCRQQHYSDRFSNFRYFSVAIFKKSFHSGYGLEVCPYGICTARYVASEFTAESVESNDKMVKHWRRLIREVMESAAKHDGTVHGGKQDRIGVEMPTAPIPPRSGGATVTT